MIRGSEWLKQEFSYLNRTKQPNTYTLSPLGARVADLLGYVLGGFYHLDKATQFQWSDPYIIEIRTSYTFGTWDGNRLTTLVFLCHELGIKLEIRPCNMQYVRLLFWDGHGKEFYRPHPTLDEAVALFRQYYQPVLHPLPSEEAL
ncbi:MAG: hypothetical protein HC893_06375 [Chloroflexaceae bacterium]|nr:hypothetical protein [Chloroflexaceae bacterium]